MYILVTNDDGIDAPGLMALRQGLARLGETVVVAPNRNWSVAGHAKTLHKPLRIDKTHLRDGSEAFVTDGAPTDCVALVLLGFLPEKPALVVSGINPACNLAQDLTYSGTVAAAMEAAIGNIPSIAVSVNAEHDETIDFSPSAEFAARIAQRVLNSGLPRDTLLNVNIPALPLDQIQGVRITHLGTRIYRDVLIEKQGPQGESYYWIGSEPPSGVLDEGTDFWAVAHDYVSITPAHLDMTSHALIERFKDWEKDSLLE